VRRRDAALLLFAELYRRRFFNLVCQLRLLADPEMAMPEPFPAVTLIAVGGRTYRKVETAAPAGAKRRSAESKGKQSLESKEAAIVDHDLAIAFDKYTSACALLCVNLASWQRPATVQVYVPECAPGLLSVHCGRLPAFLPAALLIIRCSVSLQGKGGATLKQVSCGWLTAPFAN
jgi:hypothetical protein